MNKIKGMSDGEADQLEKLLQNGGAGWDYHMEHLQFATNLFLCVGSFSVMVIALLFILDRTSTSRI